MDDLILRYVTIPMTIRILKEDKEKFKVSKMSMLYDDVFDSMIKALQHDYNELRKEMYTVHHLDIKRIGQLKRQGTDPRIINVQKTKGLAQ